jgi:hypothetical protein
MNLKTSRIPNPIKRPGAEYYLLLLLLSFAGSVTLTRTFLFLSGYPQVGGGGLHIAHVLWGGIILFIAALLPLIFANRWVYQLDAILSGIGVGLFIDEVGKFITQNNNYFYPPAATIIYAFFLLTVLVYFQVRRHKPHSPRDELFSAFDILEDVIDHDLDARERANLEARLNYVAKQQDTPDLAHLARELLDFLSSGDIQLVADNPSWIQRILNKLQAYDSRFLNRNRYRAMLSGSVGALGLVALSKLGETLIAGYAPEPLLKTLSSLINIGVITNTGGLYWFKARIILEGSVGLMMLISAVLLAFGKDHTGTWWSYFSLLLSLTVIDLFLFYFEQFSMVATAFFQFMVLMAVLSYRRRYLIHSS